MTVPLSWITIQVWRSWQTFLLSSISTIISSSKYKNTVSSSVLQIHRHTVAPPGLEEQVVPLVGKTTRCCRQRGLQSLDCAKASRGQAHRESGTRRHRDVNTAALSLEDTQRLQGYFCCYLHAYLNHDMPDAGASFGAFCPWRSSLWKNSDIHCLKTGFFK